MNSDSYILVLYGKLTKFSTTFEFIRFSEKNLFGGNNCNRSKSVLESGFSE
jgi:hypothetical protein